MFVKNPTKNSQSSSVSSFTKKRDMSALYPHRKRINVLMDTLYNEKDKNKNRRHDSSQAIKNKKKHHDNLVRWNQN